MIGALLLATVCRVDRAEYVLRGTPAVTAHFEQAPRNDDWQSGLVLAIHGSATGRTSYWLPWPGGTDGGQHIRRAWLRGEIANGGGQPARPGDLDFFTTDRSYQFATAQPRLGDVAPAHLLIPDLDLWHAGDVNGARDSSPRAFFDLASCRRSTADDRGRDVLLPVVP